MPGSRRSRKVGGGYGGFGAAGAGSPWRIERGSLALLLASVAVFAIGLAWQPLAGWTVMLPGPTLRGFQLWRLVTAPFVNATLATLIFAALGFWWLGSFLERAIGTRRMIALFIVSAAVGNLAAAVVSLAWWQGRGGMAGPECGLFAISASWWFAYGSARAHLFGRIPVRIDVVSWIFCGIALAMAMVHRDWMTVAGDVTAATAAWLVVRGGGTRLNFGLSWARLRLWWLRRRYKVLDGGKSREGREKKWMN